MLKPAFALLILMCMSLVCYDTSPCTNSENNIKIFPPT